MSILNIFKGLSTGKGLFIMFASLVVGGTTVVWYKASYEPQKKIKELLRREKLEKELSEKRQIDSIASYYEDSTRVMHQFLEETLKALTTLEKVKNIRFSANSDTARIKKLCSEGGTFMRGVKTEIGCYKKSIRKDSQDFYHVSAREYFGDLCKNYSEVIKMGNSGIASKQTAIKPTRKSSKSINLNDCNQLEEFLSVESNSLLRNGNDVSFNIRKNNNEAVICNFTLFFKIYDSERRFLGQISISQKGNIGINTFSLNDEESKEIIKGNRICVFYKLESSSNAKELGWIPI